jgi:hypothetical protein
MDTEMVNAINEKRENKIKAGQKQITSRRESRDTVRIRRDHQELVFMASWRHSTNGTMQNYKKEAPRGTQHKD